MPSWEEEIRALEDQSRAAFLTGDTKTLDALLSDDFIVNSPLEQVNDKARVLELLETGRIRHSMYECEIERISRHGDVVVVMGHDRVEGPPHGAATSRRYTNIWVLENGTWKTIARHAQLATQHRTG